MALIVHKQSVDGRTGMTRFRVQVQEKDPATEEVTLGPVEYISIYPQALANMTGGGTKDKTAVAEALKTWMSQRHAEMITRKKHIEQVSQVAADLAGTTLEFE